MLPHSQPIIPSNRTRIRSNDTRLIVLGGADNTDEVSNQLKGIIKGILVIYNPVNFSIQKLLETLFFVI